MGVDVGGPVTVRGGGGHPQEDLRPGGPAASIAGMRIDHLDHLVLTVADIDATVAFYTRVLGMEAVEFGVHHSPLASRASDHLPVWGVFRIPD